MNHLTTQYARHHYMGRDCRLTALRNIFAYFGIPETYAVIYGLSATYGFVYQKNPFNPLERLLAPECDCTQHMVVVTGNRMDCIGGLATTFNATLLRNRGDDEAESFEQITELLDQGIPVMTAVCQQYLNSRSGRAPELGKPAGSISFASHWVVLAGRDRAANTLTFFDSDLETPVTIDERIFRTARIWGDDDPGYYNKSRAAWAACIPAAHSPNPRIMVRDALARIAFRMHASNPFRAHHGDLAALLEFADELPELRVTDAFPTHKMQATVQMLRFQGQHVTGGGLGRRLFASFLRYAGRVSASDLLTEASTQSASLTRLWDELIDLLCREVLELSNTNLSSIRGLRERLAELVERETALVSQLDRFVCEG